MAQHRGIRSDEYVFYTSWALSQLSHRPKFPVINSNIGDGQNMLVIPATPVMHISALARPATWGYFFLGAQRGLAWQWWFQSFACFTVLFLLFEIVLKGHQRIASFAAFWFCSSSYVVCWSLWPAYLTFFVALGCLSLFHLLASQKTSVQFVSAMLLGLAIPGFGMLLYPPWQVPVVYLFLALFVGLVLRDKLYKRLWPVSLTRVLALSLGLLVAAGLSTSFLISTWPALSLINQTVYPGKRVILGGGYPLLHLFRGTFNLMTNYVYQRAQEVFLNQSESASFYFLFPAVVAASIVSKRIRVQLGIIGFAVLAVIAGLLVYMLIGFPEPIAKATLMSHSSPHRMDLALGLGSILLCAMILVRKREDVPFESGWRWFAATMAGSTISFFVVVLTGLQLSKRIGSFPSLTATLFAALLFGIASWLMLSGRTRFFVALVGTVCIATTAFFNPLATNLDYLYKSEIAAQIQSLNAAAGTERPLWVCYGNNYPSTLVSILGGRTIGGVMLPPPLSFWRDLDPDGALSHSYNRLNHLYLKYESDDCRAAVDLVGLEVVTLKISPTNPVFRRRGARYVLATGEYQDDLKSPNLRLVSRGTDDSFSIFEIDPLSDSNRAAESMSADGRQQCVLTGAPSYHGVIDQVDCRAITGWVWDSNHPAIRLTAALYEGSKLIATAPANTLRSDLARVPMGDGRYGFSFNLPDGFRNGNAHRIRVKILEDEFEITKTEALVECPASDG